MLFVYKQMFGQRQFVGGSLLGVSFVALAKLVGPFIMASVAAYAGVTYSSDQAMNFIAAGNLPRLIMSTAVQTIKKGDIVRIVYPDNRVFDFEAARRCSYMLSTACEFSNVTEVAAADAATTPSEFAMDLAQAKASCTGTAGTYTTSTIPLVRWSSMTDWNQATQTMTTHGFSSTTYFTFSFYIPGPRSCP